jgi:urea carboxylase
MKLLIANRGAIACRIARTARKMGLATVGVYSEADVTSLHLDACDEAVCLGPGAPRESYLSVEKILAAARRTGANLLHPGYGFLSENAAFSAACEAAGISFAGPRAAEMEAFSLKHRARELAAQSGVPLSPGSGLVASAEEALREAETIGYPVMLKSTGGGGGIGMKVCDSAGALESEFAAVKRQAEANFKDGGVFLEKYIRHARHIEVQLFGDGRGRIWTLGLRDCSTQRRNQKVIEESPPPLLPEDTARRLAECARSLGESVRYRSAGTAEFILDAGTGEFYFLEMNTRLQVEHGVTEEVLGIDLVEWMLRLALGEEDFLPEQDPAPRGHSIQARVYAENPQKNFQPSSGTLHSVAFPASARVETWVAGGTEVPPFYDPMLAKIIVHGGTRKEALGRLHEALEQTSLSGIETNLEYLQEILEDPVFVEGRATTRFLGQFHYAPHTVEVLEPGAVTTLQDFPGRLGYWHVGVPPSGPMDDASLRLANALVGNAPGAPALELTMSGPSLRFHCGARIALTGAWMDAKVDGMPMAMDRAVEIPAGAVLKIGRAAAAGCRAYLAFAGGLQVPEYLGSRSTFTLGKFGGHAGRALQAGDFLHLQPHEPAGEGPALAPHAWGNHWNIRVMYGPHGAPDFFTAEDIGVFFATDWKIHYNSNPTGIRLIGPKPGWARPDGGEAGLHPSNIHDNAYAIGTVDYTGDMPIILGPDGPSLGGFVCPATIIRADRWKMGQLRPGDTVRFVPVGLAEAEAADRALETSLRIPAYPEETPAPGRIKVGDLATPIVQHIPEEAGSVEVRYRCAGDEYLLVEYGPIVLDLDLRFRVHALMLRVEAEKLEGIIDLTPGIRSLQLHYDNRVLPRRRLLDFLRAAEAELPSLDDLEVPSRVVHLPLSWDDPQTRLAIEKYMQSVRPDAPWCPSNLEFIRRINGLASIGEVRQIVFDARYLVLGLGDVYLGAPVATPLDPRHRLVTTKYNPARTWTPENAVGIGGAYLCIYGMEGPGGYQFVGRTVQVWNAHRQTADFRDGKPWLLRFFDQIRFYPVEAGELLELRRQFPLGRFKLKTEEAVFKLKEYHAFLHQEAGGIAAFRETQRRAFAEERERWAALGQNVAAAAETVDEEPPPEEILPEGCEFVRTPLAGNLWKLLVKAGDTVADGQPVAIVEAMKMETHIPAGEGGKVLEILAQEGKPVGAGQAMLVVKHHD